MKKVSVILTTYNAEAFLQRTLDSILGQEGRGKDFELELIVVDDYSTDSTPDILMRNGIDFLRPPRKAGGPNIGRNIGLKLATGDAFCIMDHDDEWHPRKTIEQLPLLAVAPIVSCGYTVIDYTTGKKIVRTHVAPPGQNYIIYPPDYTFLKRMTKSVDGQHDYLAGLLCSSELKNIEFEECYRMSEYAWYLSVFHQRSSVEVCESRYNRYVEGHNLSLHSSYVTGEFYAALYTLESYASAYPREARLAYKRIHGTRARYHYLMGEMEQARFYFRRAGWHWKHALYYLTTFAGSEWVKRRFNVFG